MLKTSAAGVGAIRLFEGCKLTAYQDTGGVWTIGVGHTGPEVVPGLVWTQAQADVVLGKDLSRFEVAVAAAVKVPLRQGQFDALVSLAFNIGTAAFSGSTLVRKLNAGDVRGAGLQFIVWHKDNGLINNVLLNRRAAELWTFATASAASEKAA
jgi:lysozyme